MMTIFGWSGTASAAPCMADAAGDASLNCTANDFAVSAITVTNVIDGCDSIGDTFVFDADFHVGAGSTTRYDIGFYIGSDGVQAYTGSCFVATIPINQGFPDLDQDQCPDYAGAAFLVPVSSFTAACVDNDNNGFFDVAICESWDNNDQSVCNGPADAIPSNAAKCNCQQVNTDIAVPRCASNAECVSDGNPCTDEVCNPPASDLGDAFGCSHNNNTLSCDDGLFCTNGDVCGDGVCNGSARDCDDRNVCTDDSCNESTDLCVLTPNTAGCDDLTFCNGVDSCSGGTCGHAGDPCPGPDGDANCAERCNEDADDCTTADPDGSTCDDGLFCNGGPDQCADGVCSGHPGSPCDDSESCTTDACDENLRDCSNLPLEDGTACDDEEICTLEDGCIDGLCEGHETALMDLCPWIIVEREGPIRDTLKIGTRSDIGGDVCGGLVQVRNGTIIDGDLASGSTIGTRQIRLTFDALVDEDVVSAGAGVKASPGLAKIPQLSVPISLLAPGSLTEKIDGLHFYDLTGTHPLATDCINARNVIPDVIALLDGLPSNESFPKITVRSFQSLTITASNPGAINVVDIAQLRTGRDVAIELDGGGNADTVLVLRVAQKFMMKLNGTLTLTGGLLPENTLLYVKGKRCKLGDLVSGAGTMLCSNGRLKTGRTITWTGAFYGAGKILKVGDTNVLTYNPFQGF